MPFAKGVSAKSHDFDAEGNETQTDYRKMMKIVLDAGYHGYVGIEYEGSKLQRAGGDSSHQEAAGTGRDELCLGDATLPQSTISCGTDRLAASWRVSLVLTSACSPEKASSSSARLPQHWTLGICEKSTLLRFGQRPSCPLS